MRLPWQRRPGAPSDGEETLARAEETLADLKARLARVEPYIEARRRRNHLTEAVIDAVQRREPRRG